MRIDRLLSILLILSSKGQVTGKELAEHFEVSLRTIYRDVEKIGEAGVPIAATGGAGGGFYLMQQYNPENFHLSNNEIKTLTAVAGNLGFIYGRNSEFNDLILKFRNQQKTDMGDEMISISMSHFAMENELRESLYLMNKAIENSCLMKFDYINRNMEYSRRVVEPLQIAFSHGHWYLNAFCRERNDYRRFKLVRIRNPKIGEPFAKRRITSEELRRIFDQGYEKNSIRVRLRFSNKIGPQLTEYFRKEDIQQEADGGYIAEDLFPYEEGLIKYILGFGKECEVLEPLYLKEAVKKYIGELLEKYHG